MPLSEQMTAFAWTLVMGMFAGLCYQTYRVFYDLLKPKKAGTFTGDIIFWLLLTAFAFIMLLKANYGQLRLYVFIGLLLGAFLFVRLLGDPSYRVLRQIIHLAGGLLRLAGRLCYYAWKVISFPFRVIFITVIFPFNLTGRLMGRLVGQPVGVALVKIGNLLIKLITRR